MKQGNIGGSRSKFRVQASQSESGKTKIRSMKILLCCVIISYLCSCIYSEIRYPDFILLSAKFNCLEAGMKGQDR